MDFFQTLPLISRTSSEGSPVSKTRPSWMMAICRQMAIIHEGRVLLTGDPSELVLLIKGRVWKKSIDESELQDYRNRLQVTLTRRFAGRTLVHVISDGSPGDGFEPVVPDLEDLYFATIKGFVRQPAAVAAT